MNRLKGSQSRLKQPYDKESLKRAYAACVSNGMSVYRASRVYHVPESTLRDRTRHNVTLEARPGPETLLSSLEEDKLAQHIKYMASIRYGYTMTNIRFMAADYARSMGKKVVAKDGLSTVWYYSFMKRNPDLKAVKPQKLDLARAKGASEEKINNYFKKLKNILDDNDLINSPERIYNIDETGVSTQHSPPKIVCGKNDKPQAITSPRSSNVTIIGGANALGNHVPPFYIFPGKRFNSQFMEGAQPGADGTMSDSGWVNGEIFEDYVTRHLAKHPYLKAFSPSNITSAFKKSGIYPFDESQISKSDTAPSSFYSSENHDQCHGLDTQVESTEKAPQQPEEPSGSQETILKSKGAKSEKTVQNRQKNPIQTPSKKQRKSKEHEEPVPSTSGTSKTGVPISLDSPSHMSDSDTDIEIEERDKCCVCKLYTPTQLKHCVSIVFTKWAQCNFCSHWVHLRFCTPITVVRRATVFRCPHCVTENNSCDRKYYKSTYLVLRQI
ncbi:uncharacterized protein LOC132747543 [Ruditapes philippinarum]|uniref:uncharacterized protein LOC132747543 n=1 Tax=Ruditapes philippinarum TaxID=129788 RepID=UPI00295B89DF|nr:uncharacterized protein LOC132747543 [Ruditapes philippinarum]